MKLQRLVVTSAGLALLSSTAFAASEIPSKPTLLNKVVVSATRSEQQLKEVAGSVAVIDREEMDADLSQSLQDLVRYEPGVDITEGSREGASSINIRGMDGNRVKMTVDGLDLASAFEVNVSEGHPTYYIHSSRNFVDPETLQAVEIVKGSASSLFGSGAIGGLVAFRTRNPSDLLKTDDQNETAGSVKATYSSKNRGFTETLSLANRTDALESMLILTRRDNHETEVFKGGAKTSGPERGKANPQDGRVNNLLAKVQYTLNEDHRIGLTGTYQDHQNKIKIKDHPIVPANARGTDTKKRHRIGVFHEWHAEQALFDQLRWQLDWQDNSTVMRTFIPAYLFVPRDRVNNYQYQEKGIQFQTQLKKDIKLAGHSHRFIYGLNVKDLDVNNKSIRTRLDNNTSRRLDYIPKVNSQAYAVFAQHEFAPVADLTLKTGLRYDQYTYKPGEESNESSAKIKGNAKDSKLSGHLAVVYSLSENLSAFGRFSQGFKAPNLIDMYHTVDQRDQGQLIKANPNLKPEASNSFETGLRGSNTWGSFEAAVFYNRYTNFIEDFEYTEPHPDPNAGFDVSVREKRNISKAETQGIELKGQLWLDQLASVPEGVFMKGSLAYTKGKDLSKNTPLNSVAPLKAVIGLGYDAPSERWGGKLDWTLVAAKKKKDIDKADKHFATGGFGIVDLTAYYKPVEALELRAGLFNLTDKKYHLWNKARKIRIKPANAFPKGDNPDRYTQPGRNVKLSVKYSF